VVIQLEVGGMRKTPLETGQEQRSTGFMTTEERTKGGIGIPNDGMEHHPTIISSKKTSRGNEGEGGESGSLMNRNAKGTLLLKAEEFCYNSVSVRAVCPGSQGVVSGNPKLVKEKIAQNDRRGP